MTVLVVGVAGLTLGFALGWLARHQVSGSGQGSPERESRQRALEAEHARLAAELHERDTSLSELSHAAEAAAASAQENRRLIRRVRDLESALKSASRQGDEPSAALEIQLVMALKERDVAQKALLDLQAREAVLRNAAGESSNLPDFPDLPELDDTDESDEVPAPVEPVVPPETSLPPGNPDATLPPPSEDDEATLFPDDAPGESDTTLVPSDANDPDATLIPPDDISVPPTPLPTDDLTRIRGIGPATVEKLADLGLTSFRSLAALDDPGLESLEAALGSHRPSRDDWRGQAAALVSSAQED